MIKRILSMALVLCMCLSLMPASVFAESEPLTGIQIDSNNFPDSNFLAFVQTLPGAEDGTLTSKELKTITELNCRGKNIQDLTGIGYFTALSKLICYNNQLTQLDVSANTALTNLDCSNNQLTQLDVSANTALTNLDCSNNQLTQLNVSANTALTYLDCHNSQLTQLDVSANTALTYLNCYNNQLTQLNVSANTALTNLDCGNNRLTQLNVSANTAMLYLDCSNNQLTQLDVSANTALTNLNCHNNQLTQLDVSANTALTNLNCYNNQLTQLNVSANTALTDLDCSNNQLTQLDVSANTALTDLDCGNNRLTQLNVSANTALMYLYCGNNRLTQLNVSANTALMYLYCSSNRLTKLDLSTNGSLMGLTCSDNQLKTLDISRNHMPQILTCSGNQLAEMDLSGTGFVTLTCNNNRRTVPEGTALTQLSAKFDAARVSNLEGGSFDGGKVNFTADELTYTYDCGLGNTANFTLVKKAEPAIVTFKVVNGTWDGKDAADKTVEVAQTNSKGTLAAAQVPTGMKPDEGYESGAWDVTPNTNEGGITGNVTYTYQFKRKDAGIQIDSNNFPDPNFLAFVQTLPGAEDGEFSSQELDAITELYCREKNIQDLTGIGYFTALSKLNCYNNQLTHLDVSANTALTYLNCFSNQLTQLDVSANTALTNLNCSNNQLTQLNVSANTALTNLDCSNNQLTQLNVSANTAMLYLDCSNNQLTQLDVSANTALTYLNCYNNQLTQLIVSANTALTDLNCHNNQLTHLDVSANTAMTDLDCSINQLTHLDVSANTALTDLNCSNNQLTQLNVSANTALESLSCAVNQLTHLDVSANTAMTDLDCSINQLTHLDVGANTALESLSCAVNQLTQLDVSANTALESLSCGDNQLAKLNVIANTALTYLYCGNNQLAEMDLSGTGLVTLFCRNNRRTVPEGTALTQLSAKFDAARVSNLEGGSFEGGKVNFTADELTYTYDCGLGKSATFTLVKKAEPAIVTFKVVNGTWDGKDAADKTVEVAMTNGKGTLDAANVPTGMQPAEGYEGGTWDVTPNTNEDGITGNVTYTYSFASHTHTMEHHAEVSATCTESGTKEYWRCTVCNKNYADAAGKTEITDLAAWKNGAGKLEKTGHTSGDWKQNDSEHWKECTSCHAIVEKAAHTYSDWTIVKAATEAEEGLEKRICSACGHEETRVIPKLEHTHAFGDNWNHDDSNHWHECSCGAKSDITAHTMQEIIDKAPTETETGLKHSECAICGYKTKDVVIPALGHEHVFGSTWMKDDTDHWHECSCGEKADVTAHSYEWIIDKEATETTDGAKHQHCTVCGYNAASVTIPAAKVPQDKPADTVEKVEAKPLNKVPEGLKNTEFNTVEKIQQAMEKVVITKIGEYNTGNAYKTIVYDAVLMITENGVTRPATKEEIEARGGITIMFPYPAGTNKTDYVFTVVHMLTMDMAGMKAGDIETPEITLTDAGLQVTLKGLSPIMIGYSKKAAEPTPAEPTTPETTAPTTPVPAEPTVPETTAPTTPAPAEPTIPETTAPTTPTPAEPTVTETTAPTTPTPAEPTVTETTAPTAPAPAEPTVPETTAPTAPVTTEPTKPNPPTEVDVPKTGDESNILLWSLLGFAASFGMIGTALFKKKKTTVK